MNVRTGIATLALTTLAAAASPARADVIPEPRRPGWHDPPPPMPDPPELALAAATALGLGALAIAQARRTRAETRGRP